MYETPDVPEEETSDFFEENESECIERLHITTKESYNKFKGKYLTGNVDFSDRVGRKIRSGYDARSGCWELVAQGEKESPIEKCRRLQCEMNELMQEISDMNTDATISKKEKESYEAIVMVVNSAKKVLNSLRLEQVLGKEAVEAASEQEVKKLFSQVEEYKKTSGGSVEYPSAATTAANELEYTTRIAELENRLHQLETVIGAHPEKLSRLNSSLGTNKLLEAVHQVSTRAALLQPNQLDLIETRIAALATKMDGIAEKSTTSGRDVAYEQKVLELYEIAKKTEPIAQLLPNILQRMQALENLHKYGQYLILSANLIWILNKFGLYFSNKFQ